MYTKEEIFRDLAALGVPRDGVVLVHTSLKAVGETENRGEGFLDMLISYFTEKGGLLCIPTHTWKNLGTPGKLAVDMTTDETCIGTLPRLAISHPLAHRSWHPTHSMAVFDGTPTGTPGKAEDFIGVEYNRPEGTLTSTNPDGCYGKLYDLHGKILLVGVGHNRNTYLHSVEERMNVPNRLTEQPRTVQMKLPSGEIVGRQLRSHCAVGIGDVSARYVKYEPAFACHGAITYGKIGSADSQLCDAYQMAETMIQIRRRSVGEELMQDFTPLDKSLYV